jgi:hypothetical protein
MNPTTSRGGPILPGDDFIRMPTDQSGKRGPPPIPINPPVVAPPYTPPPPWPGVRPSVLSPELLNRFRQFQAMQQILPTYQSGLGNNLPALLQWGLMTGNQPTDQPHPSQFTLQPWQASTAPPFVGTPNPGGVNPSNALMQLKFGRGPQIGPLG